MWWAAFVFTLAKGRVTKELEDWILWELPFGRALAYQHCSLRSHGQWTVPLGKSLTDRLEETSVLAARIAAMDRDSEEEF